jgi:prepilin-type N-terminal cleavage/methylation domain-containing protein
MIRDHRHRGAFTLIELLVVVAIISVLISLIVPSLSRARQHARRAACASNLHHVAVAVHAYAFEYNDTIPFGPAARAGTASNFYTVTGDVTSLLSLEDGAPVGLGLLLQRYLNKTPGVLFCPGADQPLDADSQLARVGVAQAQSDYYYRHGSVAMLAGPPTTFHIRLGNLGTNANGRAISALVMDVQFLADPSLAAFDVVTRTNHLRETNNVMFADGNVTSLANTGDRFTVDIGTYPYDALERILRAFEQADNCH